MQSMRSLDEDNEPRSIVSIDRSSFNVNVSAHRLRRRCCLSSIAPERVLTAMHVFAFSFDGQSHSIHLELRQIAFVDEDVGETVVVKSGGNLRSSRCLSANSTAASIVESERGTVGLFRLEFFGERDLVRRWDRGVAFRVAVGAPATGTITIHLSSGGIIPHHRPKSCTNLHRLYLSLPIRVITLTLV